MSKEKKYAIELTEFGYGVYVQGVDYKGSQLTTVPEMALTFNSEKSADFFKQAFGVAEIFKIVDLSTKLKSYKTML